MTHDNLGKYVSYILRHRPDDIGIKMNQAGYVSVEDLITLSVVKKKYFTLDEILELVKLDDKGRFELFDSVDHGLQIRCVQGHSVAWVDVGLSIETPPEVLYHGTACQFVERIRKLGINSGKRLHVHLSEDIDTAIQSGKRKGDPVVIKVDTKAMLASGLLFYKANNGVWLADYVPSEFLI